ncbi:hypothetical protein ABGB14_48930 [Nonomuraea sp. B10E15]|uniref:hypothetical protein n=1 Tax=Nonomuraea sp. B10E15 TaxID=3153560 RepID=UPI00325DCFCA
MVEAFAAAIRRRAGEAADALRTAERDGDAEAALAAAGALDEMLRMARAHGVSTGPGHETGSGSGTIADPGSPDVVAGEDAR